MMNKPNEEYTAIFDIGKTNKKFFLFDNNFQEVESEYIRIPEINDEDGFPTEDLDALEEWVFRTFDHYLLEKKYKITKLNFSTYGASLVHLDKNGKKINPFYNYLKAIPNEIHEKLYAKYGGKAKFCKETSSPALGMLNSGIQLYWLKNVQPEKYDKIKTSLHFPNYLSYLFTGKKKSEYTSLGCHTALWDFSNNRYHTWVNQEGLNTLLAPLTSANHTTTVRYKNHLIQVGPGIHDSSAALIPYLQGENDRFILMSTGTWSICLNFFNDTPISEEELKKDSLNFLSTSGSKIKASRLFLGAIFKEKATLLEHEFHKAPGAYKHISFNYNMFLLACEASNNYFNLESLNSKLFGVESPEYDLVNSFDTYEEAYHQLIYELTTLQIKSLNLAVGDSQITKIYIDGGFATNEVFLQTLFHRLPSHIIYTTDFSLGTALGACMSIHRNLPYTDFLQSNYKVHQVKASNLPVD